MTDIRSQIAQELQVSTPLINEQLETQAARFAYWGSLATDANKRARTAKMMAEVIEAQLTAEVRNTWPEGGGQRSEWAVMTAVKLDLRWQEAWNQYYEAKQQAEILQVAKEGFAQRKDLLITISANLRGEMSGQVRIVKESLEKVTPYTPPKEGSRLQQLQSTFHQQKEMQNE